VTLVIIGYIAAATGSFSFALLFVFAHTVVALPSFGGQIRRRRARSGPAARCCAIPHS
jgi:hypothetical protein